MKHLIFLLLLLTSSGFICGQSSPWQLIVDGTPPISSPISLIEGRTDVNLSNNFEFKSKNLGANIYNVATGKLTANLNDVFLIRFGFSYRVTPGQTFAEFAVFADVGTGIDPVKIGYYIEGRPDVWRSDNPEATIFAGDSVSLNGAQIYIEVYGGGVDIAELDLYVEMKHVEDGVSIAALEQSADLLLSVLTSDVDLDWDIENLDSRWSNLNGTLTYTGKPNFVDVRFNAKVFISNTANLQRPNYVAKVIRVNDGKVLAQAASTYIRDSNDHEEASWNISVIDYDPPENPQYKIVYYRETSLANQPISIESEGAIFTAISF